MVRSFDTPITTNDQSIDRVLSAGLPVALVFLEGNPPAGLEDGMNRLARAHAGDLLVARLHVKDNPETTRRYSIYRTPAIVTIKNGQEFSKAEGINASELEKHILYLLGKGQKPEPAHPSPTYSSARTTGAGAADGHPQTVTDATFEQEVMRSNQTVLVDFWAPWCGPCRMVEPVVEKMAHELAGRLKIAKVNVDENPMTAQRYGIQSIPTMMVVKNGEIKDRWMGALPEPAIRSRVTPYVG